MKKDLEIRLEDYYKVLGIDPDASQEEIKEAYRDKAFIFHSDRLAGAPESARHCAEEELKKVNLAYSVLRDPKKRQRYSLEQTCEKGEKVERGSVDEIYCPECGKVIKRQAVICPFCKVQLKELKVSVETLSFKTKPFDPEEALLLEEGRRQLGGIKLFYGFTIMVIFIPLIALLGMCLIAGQLPGEAPPWGDIIQFMSVLMFFSGIILAIYITPLVGIIKRRPYSVPFTRALLVITMFCFPIGTKIGANLWKRINHPLAKKYLNYRMSM